jgi:Calpain family cysteine protease
METIKLSMEVLQGKVTPLQMSKADQYSEAIEDLTGGVASCIRSENVLYKNKLWAELMQVNDKFLFGAYTRGGRDADSADDEGFVRGHAYTVLGAHEIDPPKPRNKKKKGKDDEDKPSYISKDGKVRLLKLHNPWGRQEWNGPWSDGSKEWTHEIMKELDHTFDDDGTFFIAFPDFLKFFPVIDRIRLIGPEWYVERVSAEQTDNDRTITQQWTSVNVPLAVEYLDTSFKVTLTKPGPVVFVLSQPDTRYFRGLTGRYQYNLHFRLYKDGEDTYFIRSMEHSGQMRSCNAEVEELEPGTYELLVKVTAFRDEDNKTPEEVIRENKEERREKLIAIGKSFDMAHSKGHLRDLEKSNRQSNMEEELDYIRDRLTRNREQRKKVRTREKMRRKRAHQAISEKREARQAKQKEMRDAKRKENQAKHEAEKAAREKNVKANTDKDEKMPTETEHADSEATLTATMKRSEPAEIETPDTPDVDNGALPPSSTATFETAVSEITIEIEDAAENQATNGTLSDPQPRESINTNNADEDIISVRGPPPPPPPGLRSSMVPPPPPPPGVFARDANVEYIRLPNESRSRGPPPGARPGYYREFSSDSNPSSPLLSPASSVCDDDFPFDSNMDGPITPDLYSDSELSADDMYVKDPWQASCVIGLRVCSLDENAKIEVCKGVTRARRKRGEIAMGRARSPA